MKSELKQLRAKLALLTRHSASLEIWNRCFNAIVDLENKILNQTVLMKRGGQRRFSA